MFYEEIRKHIAELSSNILPYKSSSRPRKIAYDHIITLFKGGLSNAIVGHREKCIDGWL